MAAMNAFISLDWIDIAAQLDREGYCVLRQLARCDPHGLFDHLLPIATRWLGAVAPAGPLRIDASTMLPGDFAPLRQGVGVFPLQAVMLLSEPAVDFTGGECVLVEQRPRMQSRPMVLPLRCGDLAIIAAGRRPVQGRSGVVTMTTRHAISVVRSGRRVGQILSWGTHD
jgi:hypothetical protein